MTTTTQTLAAPFAGFVRSNRLFPLVVGLLLGALQTGLFFQLTFTLSSGFGTYLLITLCWLSGGALGASFLHRLPVTLRQLQALMLAAYALCGLLVVLNPFDTRLVPVYMLLIGAAGLYPGVFFARWSGGVTARGLFFWENNGFVLGIVATTVLFMLGGRTVLWALPAALALAVWRMSGAPSPHGHEGAA
ncbi:MAG: hypothetical protein IPK19_20215 [Chloroflexi bacterium]|nr:hypothetical protein [Chloroflexota bacterium]